MQSDDRYSRQSRLPEVGRIGQERLGAADMVTFRDAAGAVEREYLLRAGARSAKPTDAPPPLFAHREAFAFGPAKTIAEGCWRALRQVKTVLHIEGT